MKRASPIESVRTLLVVAQTDQPEYEPSVVVAMPLTRRFTKDLAELARVSLTVKRAGVLIRCVEAWHKPVVFCDASSDRADDDAVAVDASRVLSPRQVQAFDEHQYGITKQSWSDADLSIPIEVSRLVMFTEGVMAFGWRFYLKHGAFEYRTIAVPVAKVIGASWRKPVRRAS